MSINQINNQQFADITCSAFIFLTARFVFKRFYARSDINPYKPRVLIVEHRQTAQTQSRRRTMRRQNRVSTGPTECSANI